METTIKDVAKLANVSTMTVSRVVNNKGMIAETTRKKVQDAIRELNYKPNTIARTLVAQKSRVISIVVPDIINPFFSELIKIADEEVKRLGYTIFASDANWNAENERDIINTAIASMTAGIILVTPRLSDEELVDFSRKIRLVVVDRDMSEVGIESVYVDNYYGAFEATSYLISLGHRRIGYIKGWSDVLNSKRREQGYKDALLKSGIEFCEELVTGGDYQEMGGREAFEYFSSLVNPPTAVFASNDLMAYGFINSCSGNGCSVPKDISVMGFDDIKVFYEHNPRLSTVRHPRGAMILKAVNILLSQPAEEVERFDQYLHTELIIRDSVIGVVK